MKSTLFLSLFFLTLNGMACKTVSRDQFGSSISDITINVPKEMSSLDSKVALTRTDSKADPKIIRGQDLKLRLPTGSYRIDMILTDKDGKEEYVACDKDKIYTFTNPKEDAIIDLCRSTDKVFIGRTLASVVPTTPIVGGGEVVKPPVVNPPVVNPPVVIAPTPPTPGGTDPVDPPEPPKPEAPVFAETTMCFGFPATTVREGSEVVIKLNAQFKDYLFTDFNFPKCRLKLFVPKPVGEGIAPLNYKVDYKSDDETLKQTFFISATGKVETDGLATPCKGLLLTTNENSLKPFQCSMYDTTPERRYFIVERNKPAYEALCKAETKELNIDLVLNGKVDNYIRDMTIFEIRVQIPFAEKCIKPAS